MILRDVIFAMLFFVAIFIGFGSFITTITPNYSAYVNSSAYYSDTSAQVDTMFSSLNGTVSTLENNVKTIVPAQNTNPILDVPIYMVTGGYTAITTIMGIPKIMLEAASGISDILHLPSWFFGIFSAILLIFIIFEIISAVALKSKI